jgi:2-keto-4-pentenoate hydratase/2-oxohepta-3-ene-1,7-dioic acid hydratase in catechol pathway
MRENRRFEKDRVMRLLRVGAVGQERPALLDGQGLLRDLSAYCGDIGGATLSPEGLAALRALDPSFLPVLDASSRFGPCVAGVRKIVCVGLNYADHAAEAGMPVPTEPVLFMKPVSSLCGAFDDVEIPRGSQKTDWEVELAVVMGQRAKYVDEDSALDYVAGYCVANDVSERAFQLERGGQWDKGKGHDTFAPIGPWLVTSDQIPDPQALDLWLEVDGRRCQNGNTRTMVFGVRTVVSYISRFMTLEPGDLIFTGTPPGVGMGHKPPVFLKSGQVMRLGVQGLGEQRLRCVAL